MWPQESVQLLQPSPVMAMDAVLFMGQNFNFMSLPSELTTGSSIMPHKKNPDVLELSPGKMQPIITDTF